MDEAILIDIAQRFRRLEDMIEEAHIFEGADDTGREEVETALDACRDDMVAMQEAIRRAFDPTAPKAAKSIP